jgi:NAD(P)H-nitrite reductase large subunit
MSRRRLVVVGNGMGGARLVEELVSRAIRDRTRASSGCGSCTPEVQKIVDFACGVLAYVGAGTHGHGRA